MKGLDDHANSRPARGGKPCLELRLTRRVVLGMRHGSRGTPGWLPAFLLGLVVPPYDRRRAGRTGVGTAGGTGQDSVRHLRAMGAVQNIKRTDVVLLGMWQKHRDQVAENLAYLRKAWGLA